MFSILPFLLILVALAIVVVVIVRKLPQLTLLDVDSIPEVQIDKKKDEYLKKRVEKNVEAFKKKRQQLFGPLVQKLKEIQLSFRQYVGRVQKRVLEDAKKRREAVTTEAEKTTDLLSLRQDGEYALEQKNWDAAEKKFIEMIKIDPKDQSAYYGLGKVYREKGEKKEAEEAFEFLLQLDPNHDDALMQLAEMAKDSGDLERAIGYYERGVLLEDNKANRFIGLAELFLELGKNEPALEAVRQAVDLEPQNPKYLDMLVEVSVKCGNKDLANEAYQQLRMANPDNNKLAVLKDKINQMPS